ncbi:unnamed protein product [Porites evermanni]|uniref:Uncharacterized protein n=1 Tax=Porites evermanni TaxID=104178 RepID=A0ABN8MLR4_9CNID|nr:unnamed protein product [Porites evermanni]
MMEHKSSGTFPKGCFDRPENKNVNQQILARVQSTDGVTPVSTIKVSAPFNYFKSLFKLSLNDNKQDHDGSTLCCMQL